MQQLIELKRNQTDSVATDNNLDDSPTTKQPRIIAKKCSPLSKKQDDAQRNSNPDAETAEVQILRAQLEVAKDRAKKEKQNTKAMMKALEKKEKEKKAREHSQAEAVSKSLAKHVKKKVNKEVRFGACVYSTMPAKLNAHTLRLDHQRSKQQKKSSKKSQVRIPTLCRFFVVLFAIANPLGRLVRARKAIR